MNRSLTALAVLLAVVLAACGQGSPADRAVTAFHGQPKDIYTLDVESVRHPADLRSAALAHLDDPDPDIHFGAFYALTLTADDGPSMDALQRSLQSTDVSERLLAAGALVSRGQAAGLPVLIDALDRQAGLGWLDPPMPAWAYARFLLLTHTDQDLGLRRAGDAAAAAAAKPAWTRWYRAHTARLVWDAAAGRWSG